MGNWAYAQDDTLRLAPPVDTGNAVKQVDTIKTAPAPRVKRDTASVVRPLRPVVPPPDSSTLVQVEQAPDSLSVKDTLATLTTHYGQYVMPYIETHPYFDTVREPLNMPSRPFSPPGKDVLFYLMCGLLMFLAALRMAFPKYFQDMFYAFWRPAFRQAQTRDHLQEAGLSTLVFNIFFVLSLGLFAYLVILYLKPDIGNPLLLYTFSVLGVLVLYSGKYLIFKLTGWMFGRGEIVSTYLFIVLLINKVLAVLLIPFLLILAFSDPALRQTAFTISLILVIILFLYRYVLTFTGLRNDLKISALHLALFVLGFEIIPVLLIYRGLVQFFERSL